MKSYLYQQHKEQTSSLPVTYYSSRSSAVRKSQWHLRWWTQNLVCGANKQQTRIRFFHLTKRTIALLTSLAKKYRNAFEFVVGALVWFSPVPDTLSRAAPLWKSNRTVKTWNEIPTSVVLGSSPLNTKWLYGNFPAILCILISVLWALFIAVLSSEQSKVKTSRREVFWTRWSV